jgi:hypothetical protein
MQVLAKFFMHSPSAITLPVAFSALLNRSASYLSGWMSEKKEGGRGGGRQEGDDACDG